MRKVFSPEDWHDKYIKDTTKRDIEFYPVLSAVAIILINCVIVYFGRIYHPDNFRSTPDVTFFENLWVLTLGECFIGAIIAFIVWALWYFGKELIDEIKSLFGK